MWFDKTGMYFVEMDMIKKDIILFSIPRPGELTHRELQTCTQHPLLNSW